MTDTTDLITQLRTGRGLTETDGRRDAWVHAVMQSAADALEAQAREIAELKAWHAAGYAGQLESRLAALENATKCPWPDECQRAEKADRLAAAERDAERWRKASDAALLIYDRNARKIVQDFIAIWSRWGATDSADVLRTPDDPLSPNYDPTYADQPSAGTCDHFPGQTVCEWCKGTGAVDAPTSADDPSCPKCDGEGHG